MRRRRAGKIWYLEKVHKMYKSSDETDQQYMEADPSYPTFANALKPSCRIIHKEKITDVMDHYKVAVGK